MKPVWVCTLCTNSANALKDLKQVDHDCSRYAQLCLPHESSTPEHPVWVAHYPIDRLAS